MKLRCTWSTLATGVLFAALSCSAIAQSTDDSPGLSKLPARSERLDIYGAGMCHQCEWRPHVKMMAAQEQCGADTDGKARVGMFECGRTPQCDSVCNFISCESN